MFANTSKLKVLGWTIQYVTLLCLSGYQCLFIPCGPSSTVRTMICLHPYNTWPLHVKLFTKDAVKHWEDAANRPPSLSLPPGFTCRVELEGVNGKSGLVGSGRKGPIDVTDGANQYIVPMLAFLISIDRTIYSGHSRENHGPGRGWETTPLFDLRRAFGQSYQRTHSLIASLPPR